MTDELLREETPLQAALRENRWLREQLAEAKSKNCRTCGGTGSIKGFLLGTLKQCPACDGSGVRGQIWEWAEKQPWNEDHR